MAKVLVPLADGCEEMEAVIVIDVLRRAGIEVVAASIGKSRTVTASRNVRLLADALWKDVHPDDFDALVLPGGVGGAEHLAAQPEVLEAVRVFLACDRLVGAICAAPRVLAAAGVLEDRTVTSHPSAAGDLAPATYSEDRVVVDGCLITSRGPGTAFEFALALVTVLVGAEKAAETAGPMILPSL